MQLTQGQAAVLDRLRRHYAAIGGPYQSQAAYANSPYFVGGTLGWWEWDQRAIAEDQAEAARLAVATLPLPEPTAEQIGAAAEAIESQADEKQLPFRSFARAAIAAYRKAVLG